MASNSKSLFIRVGVVVVLAAAALIWYLAWSAPEALVAKVITGTATHAVSGSVTVQSVPMDLKSEQGGRVVKSYLELDRRVKKGDVLVQIDDGDLLLEIERMTNEYEAAKKTYAAGSSRKLELDASNEALADAERRFKGGMMSEAELNQKRRENQGVKQAYEQDEIKRALDLKNFETGLAAKKRALGQKTIRSPFDGIVTDRSVVEGDLVGVGAPMAHLIMEELRIEARLSEENIAGVKIGQRAYVQFLPYDIKQFDAKVIKVMSSANPETQRYSVDLDVKTEADYPLKSGMTGEVSIILAERPSKTLVPRRALFALNGTEANLYVVKDSETELRKVKLGFISMTTVEVLEGVTTGELVIIDQLDQFSPGKRVKTVLTQEATWR